MDDYKELLKKTRPYLGTKHFYTHRMSNRAIKRGFQQEFGEPFVSCIHVDPKRNAGTKEVKFEEYYKAVKIAAFSWGLVDDPWDEDIITDWEI